MIVHRSKAYTVLLLSQARGAEPNIQSRSIMVCTLVKFLRNLRKGIVWRGRTRCAKTASFGRSVDLSKGFVSQMLQTEEWLIDSWYVQGVRIHARFRWFSLFTYFSSSHLLSYCPNSINLAMKSKQCTIYFLAIHKTMHTPWTTDNERNQPILNGHWYCSLDRVPKRRFPWSLAWKKWIVSKRMDGPCKIAWRIPRKWKLTAKFKRKLISCASILFLIWEHAFGGCERIKETNDGKVGKRLQHQLFHFRVSKSWQEAFLSSFFFEIETQQESSRTNQKNPINNWAIVNIIDQPTKITHQTWVFHLEIMLVEKYCFVPPTLRIQSFCFPQIL